MGLRELKKHKTRKRISDVATWLFIERGYGNVTTAEIAERAEVSVPTLFNYFPNKESLVFDEDDEIEAAMIAAVVNRRRGTPIIDAILEHWLHTLAKIKAYGSANHVLFMKMVESTPELAIYARRMWMRHEQSLAATIRKESGEKLSRPESEALAHFVLDAYHRAIAAPQSRAVLQSLFERLRRGWNA